MPHLLFHHAVLYRQARARCRRGMLALMVVGLLGVRFEHAHADDVEVDSQTTLQAYDVTSPATPAVWSRRRLTQSLGLRYVRTLADQAPDHDEPSPAAIEVYARLRLNQEFGGTCTVDDKLCYAVVDPARRGSYTPIASNGLLDLPMAYAEVRELPYGSSVRLGRQFRQNALGFTRIDGLSARVSPLSWLSFDAGAGMLVRRESVAGTDAFVPDGVPRTTLDPLERARANYFAPEATTWVVDSSLEVGDLRWLRGSVAFRVLQETSGVLQRRLGAALVSQPIKELRLDAHGVFDTIDPALVDLELGARTIAAPWSAYVEAERHVPRFDASSIWAYFEVAPTWLGSAGLTRKFGERWDSSIVLRGRRTELSTAAEHDAGVELTTGFYAPRTQCVWTGFGWNGGTGPLWGTSLSGSHRLTYVITLEAEASLMRIDDPLRSVISGVSIFELVGVRFAVSSESDLRIVLSHAQSEPVGHRVALMGFLHLGAWR